MNSEQTKFCINCKHFELEAALDKHPELGRCKLFPTHQRCLVSGKVKIILKFAENFRLENDGNCGPEAKYFEQK